MEKVLIGGGSGSGRRYWRLPGGRVYCQGTNKKENDAFIAHTRRFMKAGLPVPKLLEVDDDGMGYTLSDLGDTSLLDVRLSGDADAFDRAMTHTMQLLPKFHYANLSPADFDVCYPVTNFDRQSMMWDLNYFKYCFLMQTGIQVDEPGLEKDFDLLVGLAEQSLPKGFMLRDFQSRNVMIDKDGNPYFIDYQGGRIGNLLYDVASMLWQSRLDLSPEEREKYLQVYFKASDINDDPTIRMSLEALALLRTLQTLGAYGLRGLSQRKPAFLTPINKGLANAIELCEGPTLHLLGTLQKALYDAWSALTPAPQPRQQQLTVTVSSFGFRKSGIPVDKTGNGGGFVYDCRALPNPHRVDELRPLTGRDTPIIEWLGEKPEVKAFLDAAVAQVDASVKRYSERGFSNLSVAFGCTGGRHRSVYLAEQLAEHLRAAFAEIKVTVNHTEL